MGFQKVLVLFVSQGKVVCNLGVSFLSGDIVLLIIHVQYRVEPSEFFGLVYRIFKQQLMVGGLEVLEPVFLALVGKHNKTLNFLETLDRLRELGKTLNLIDDLNISGSSSDQTTFCYSMIIENCLSLLSTCLATFLCRISFCFSLES